MTAPSAEALPPVPSERSWEFVNEQPLTARYLNMIERSQLAIEIDALCDAAYRRGIEACLQICSAEWNEASTAANLLHQSDERRAASLADAKARAISTIESRLRALAPPQEGAIIAEAKDRLISAEPTTCPKCGAQWGIIGRCAASDCPSTEARLSAFRKSVAPPQEGSPDASIR